MNASNLTTTATDGSLRATGQNPAGVGRKWLAVSALLFSQILSVFASKSALILPAIILPLSLRSVLSGSPNEGKKYIAKTRMQNASTLAPSSIDEAKKLYAASSAHFGEQLNQFLTNSGYAIGMTYGVGSIANYQNIGLWEEGKNSQPVPFVTYFHESGGYEKFNVMAEEAVFYGAVANLGEKNKEFRNAYNADPRVAIIDYAQELGDEMERLRLPEGRSALMPPDTRPRYRRMTAHDNPADVFAPGMTHHPVDNKSLSH